MIPPDLMAAILERPADDAPRLASADWLDEHAGTVPCGRCEGTGWTTYRTWHGPTQNEDESSTSSGPCDRCSRAGTVPDGLAVRAAYIRSAVALGRLNLPDGPCPPGCPCGGEADRQAETVRANGDRWAPPLPGERHGDFQLIWVRGFVARVRCALADWQQHAPALLAAHPLERVEAADVPGLVFEVLPPGAGGDGFPVWGLRASLDMPAVVVPRPLRFVGDPPAGRPGPHELEAQTWREQRTFATRRELVDWSGAEVGRLTARLRAAAGDRWPGLRAEGREIGPLPEMWSGVGQGQCRQCRGTGSGVGNISSWCVVCRGTGFVPVSSRPADAPLR